MGYQLWISPMTGIRRKGTTFKELQTIFIDNITTKLIYEPIYCCRADDYANEVKEDLERRDFDVIGVIDENENIFGFAFKKDLIDNTVNEYTRKIELENITADSTPIIELLSILSNNPYSFVIQKNKIVGIVTRADINKPIVRIYIFGIISLLEMHLNFWIIEYYKNDLWNTQIQKKRFEEAKKIFITRKGNNDDLTLLECVQFCDKRDILKKTDEFLGQFKFSKNQFERILKDSEKIRNELAHSHNSIIANLNWKKFVSTISSIELFLHKSEDIGETRVQTHRNE